MLKQKIIFILMAAVLFPAVSITGEPVSSEFSASDENAEIFAKIAESSSGVSTISSNFLQEKHLKMMEKVIVSKGLFYFQKPDRLRWEFVEPSAFGFSVNGDSAKRWRGKKGHTRSFKISREPIFKVIIDQVFSWANADFKQLEKGYDILVISKEPIVLKLIPRKPREKKIIDHLMLTFANAASHVDSVEVHEKGNDFTRIRFTNIILNEILQQNLF